MTPECRAAVLYGAPRQRTNKHSGLAHALLPWNYREVVHVG
ncbi:hypothetical protein OOU_Y34scaffold00714g6 [Pyricularia oryzae Y34]|uniref:Uncharacterized protein n=1 Tax=Pyricularia oryzae (strain Y34) TaxID=1143189 RepID=A0AA97PI09_PYRO3|nr:hypothetical protein OOU_Y34scaffold00714g6 [Pyricularia oryzae Y34]